jgi:HD superfamily phosphohydrolase YqeK
MTRSRLHPIIVAAAEGRLPAWAQVRPERTAHMSAVAGLLAEWAEALGLNEEDRVRWAAAGWLHDALRDADPAELAADADGYPERVRHGPAAAAYLEREGVADEEVLEAVRFHTLGRRGWGRLGRYLYLADYLEPGRSFDREEQVALISRLPRDLDAVLHHVCAKRLEWLRERGLPVHPETEGFWREVERGG